MLVWWNFWTCNLCTLWFFITSRWLIGEPRRTLIFWLLLMTFDSKKFNSWVIRKIIFILSFIRAATHLLSSRPEAKHTSLFTSIWSLLYPHDHLHQSYVCTLVFLQLKFSYCYCTSYVETWVDSSKWFRIGVISCFFMLWNNYSVNKFSVNFVWRFYPEWFSLRFKLKQMPSLNLSD